MSGQVQNPPARTYASAIAECNYASRAHSAVNQRLANHPILARVVASVAYVFAGIVNVLAMFGACVAVTVEKIGQGIESCLGGRRLQPVNPGRASSPHNPPSGPSSGPVSSAPVQPNTPPSSPRSKKPAAPTASQAEEKKPAPVRPASVPLVQFPVDQEDQEPQNENPPVSPALSSSSNSSIQSTKSLSNSRLSRRVPSNPSSPLPPAPTSSPVEPDNVPLFAPIAPAPTSSAVVAATKPVPTSSPAQPLEIHVGSIVPSSRVIISTDETDEDDVPDDYTGSSTDLNPSDPTHYSMPVEPQATANKTDLFFAGLQIKQKAPVPTQSFEELDRQASNLVADLAERASRTSTSSHASPVSQPISNSPIDQDADAESTQSERAPSPFHVEQDDIETEQPPVPSTSEQILAQFPSTDYDELASDGDPTELAELDRLDVEANASLQTDSNESAAPNLTQLSRISENLTDEAEAIEQEQAEEEMRWLGLARERTQKNWAAITIQRFFRGHQVRLDLNRKQNAATLIQAAFRDYQARKEMQQGAAPSSPATPLPASQSPAQPTSPFSLTAGIFSVENPVITPGMPLSQLPVNATPLSSQPSLDPKKQTAKDLSMAPHGLSSTADISPKNLALKELHEARMQRKQQPETPPQEETVVITIPAPTEQDKRENGPLYLRFRAPSPVAPAAALEEAVEETSDSELDLASEALDVADEEVASQAAEPASPRAESPAADEPAETVAPTTHSSALDDLAKLGDQDFNLEDL